MPQRFGQADDYSQYFAALYQRNQDAIESSIASLEREREERAAAQDSLMFTRWQEGKISGSELMAYINKRARQTKYDKAQQLKWREAAITYGNQIADEQAEAAYAQNGDINALIAHYAGRLGAAASGTPERRELAERLKALRDQRDRESLERQARQIARQVKRGDKSTKDLINFYQQKLQELPRGSELRQQVQDTLVDLRAQYRDEQFNSAMTRIDTALAAGAITPQQAATQKQALLGRYDIRDRDPESFWKWQEHIRQLQATVDPVEVQKLEYRLEKGTITPEQYAAQIDIWASQIAKYDQAAAWDMRTEAQKYINEYATPLPNPGALGLSGSQRGVAEIVKGHLGNAIVYKPQFDSGRFASTNCGMASGAMLAHAMGFTGLSGSDLRYLSGDVEGGTNVSQVQMAFEKLGIKGTRLSYGASGGIAFEKFKQRVMNGAPAVLQGMNYTLPGELRPYSYTGGHGVFVAGYDPKRDAFLVLDPANTRDTKGVWWPAKVVQQFGWTNEMAGLALFAPPKTLDPKDLSRARGKVVHISVDAKPSLPSTPKAAGGLYDPGPAGFRQSAESIARKQAKREDKRMQARLRSAGLDPGPELDTVQEVQAELDRRAQAADNAMDLLDGYMEGYLLDGEEAREVTIGATTTTLTREEVLQAHEDLIRNLDGLEMLYDATGNQEAVRKMRKQKADLVQQGLALKTPDVQAAQGRIIRELNKSLDTMYSASTPGEREKAYEEVIGHAMVVAEATNYAIGRKKAEQERIRNATTRVSEAEGQIATLQQEVGIDTGMEALFANFLQVIMDPESTREDMVAALSDALPVAKEMGIDIKMPDGWETGRVSEAGAAKANQTGLALSGLLQRTAEDHLMWTTDEEGNRVPRLDNNEQPLAEFVMIDGTLEVIPTIPDRGDGGQAGLRTLDPQYLDPKRIERVSSGGYGSFEEYPRVIINDGRGGTMDVIAIPEHEAYDGIEFLYIPKDATAEHRAAMPAVVREAFAQRSNNGQADVVLDEDELASLTSAKIIQLSRVGALERRSYMVDSLILPDENGQPRIWYRDPEDMNWWRDNLPYTSRTSGVGNYTAGELGPDGQPRPILRSDGDYDEAVGGVPMPYAGDISPQRAQAHVAKVEELTGMPVSTGMERDTSDPNIVTPLPEGTSGADAYGRAAKSATARFEEQRQFQLKVREGAARYIANIEAMEDLEVQAAMNDLGLYADPQGVVRRKGDAGAVAKSELDQMLEGMGISKGQREEVVKPDTGLPVRKVVDEALQAVRTRAENLRADAAKKAADKEASKLAIPKVQPKEPTDSAIGGIQTRRGPSTGYDPLSSAPLPTAKPTTPAPAPTTKPTTPTPAPTQTPYKYTPPVMDEEGRTALGGGR